MILWAIPATAAMPVLIWEDVDPFIGEAYIYPQAVFPTPVPLKKDYEPVGTGFCVPFVQAHGFKDYRGNARDWVQYINSEIGWPGYAVLLDEGGYYQHLALIIGTDGGYNLIEQNYEGLYVVSERTIPFDYDKIIGFISPPPRNQQPND
jgi:hypothetical protein